MGFDGPVLVEKPLFHEIHNPPQNKFKDVWVGYNLRFHTDPEIKNNYRERGFR